VPLTIDDTLLVICSRVKFSENCAVRCEPLVRQVDWDSVLARALRHRVGPYIHRHVIARKHLESLVPPAAAAESARRYQITCIENDLKAQALEDIWKGCARDGIRAIAIKGSALNLGVYPENWVREGRDLDFLLADGDIDTFCGVLRGLGFEQGIHRPGSERVTPPDARRFREYNDPARHPCHVWPYFRLSPGLVGYSIAVDPHTSITPGNAHYSLRANDVLSRATEVSYRSVNGYVPSLPDHLALLCLAFFRDMSALEYMRSNGDMKLRNLCDIYETSLRLDTNGWRVFADVVNAQRLEFPVWQVFSLLEAVYGEPCLDHQTRQTLYRPELEGSEQWITDQLNFPGPLPIGYWEDDLSTIFSSTERYWIALDKLFCNGINRNVSAFRDLRQLGDFVRLEVRCAKTPEFAIGSHPS
jgi:hypothetical protein